MELPEPTYEPITLEQARKQCKVDAFGDPPTHPDDDLIEIYISAAREWAELDTGCSLAQRQLPMAIDAFPTNGDGIPLPVAPVLSILSITYLNTLGIEVEVPNVDYELDIFASPREIVLTPNSEWPSDVGDFNNPIRITYMTGYSSPEESPQDAPMPRSVKAAILLVVGHLYDHRNENVEVALQTIPMGAKAFLDVVRRRVGMA